MVTAILGSPPTRRAPTRSSFVALRGTTYLGYATLPPDHIIYALALIVVAVFAAGDTWGFGKTWKALPIVQKFPWLI